MLINKKELSRSIKIASIRNFKDSDDQEFLAKCQFFKRLDRATVAKMNKLMVPRLVEEGKRIYEIGDVAQEMFIVRTGCIKEEIDVTND